MGSWRAHQRMLNGLELRLLENDFYEHIYREVIYKDLRGRAGEIDLFGTHKNTAIIFEVKSGVKKESYIKALYQLDRASKYLRRQEMFDRVLGFSYTGKYGLQYEFTDYRKL